MDRTRELWVKKKAPALTEAPSLLWKCRESAPTSFLAIRFWAKRQTMKELGTVILGLVAFTAGLPSGNSRSPNKRSSCTLDGDRHS
jgi:hypothetical protein